MSLTASLRPANFTFPGTSPHRTSHTESDRPFHHEPKYINLSRMLIRYQQLILLTPDPTHEDLNDLTATQRQIQADLWSPLPFHRTKWLHNIDGARSLLLQLERAAQNLRVQRAKQNALKDLAEKRTIIKRLRNKVEEIQREVEAMGEDAFNAPQTKDGRETAVDVLRLQKKQDRNSVRSEELLQEGKPVHHVEEVEAEQEVKVEDSSRDKLFESSSNVRRRGQQDAPNTSDTGKTTGYREVDAGERVMLESSGTQEALSQSLVSMAVQLKQQARAFQFSLDQDKGLLDRALDGLDRNLSGMEAASKNMAFLKRMSEGEGWWGRLKLYGLIFAMWIVAFVLVFVGPKLRF